MTEALVPRTAFAAVQWWGNLTETQQMKVQDEFQQLAEAVKSMATGRLAVGEHLCKIRAILEPKRLFNKFLSQCRIKRSTAYNYMNGYLNANKCLPLPALELAIARGMNLLGERADQPLGKYDDVAKRFPAPRRGTLQDYDVWLDKLEERYKAKLAREAEGDEYVDIEDLKKETYKFFVGRYRKLTTGKQRQRFVHDLAGMMLTELGVGAAQSVAPIAVPEGFRVKEAGRPRMQAA